MSQADTLKPHEKSPAAASERDPIADLLAHLERGAQELARGTTLEITIRHLADAAQNGTAAMSDPLFRTKVAWALQDMERLAGPIGTLPANLRAEMTDRAAHYPGLLNENLQELMQLTRRLPNQPLVDRIRNLAEKVAREAGDQNGQLTQQVVAGLDKQVRAVIGAQADTPKMTGAQGTDTRKPGGSAARNAEIPAAASARSPNAPVWDGAAAGPQPAQRAASHAPEPSQAGSVQGMVRGPGVLAQVVAGVGRAVREDAAIAGEALGALFRHAKAENPIVQRAASPIVERARRQEEGLRQADDARTMQGAEASQQTAIDALTAFTTRAGSSILTRIQDAAKNNPGGLETVLSEMRPGGKFADLRAAFNADLAIDRRFASAYDHAVASVAKYAGDREAVARIGVRTGGTEAIDAKFEKLDAEIGKAASLLPSREDGKSLLNDLNETVREIVNKAVDAVKSVFIPGAKAESSPSPSP